MRPIHSLIEENLLNRAQNVQLLTTSLHSRLSSELRRHCWVIDIIGNTLVLITDSAERATTLRYQQHELIKQINEEFRQSIKTPVRRLKIKVDYNLAKFSANTLATDPRPDTDIDRAKFFCQQMRDLIDDASDH